MMTPAESFTDWAAEFASQRAQLAHDLELLAVELRTHTSNNLATNATAAGIAAMQALADLEALTTAAARRVARG